MPKSVFQRAKQYSRKGLVVRNDELWCKYCNVEIQHSRKCVIDKHITSRSHLKKVIPEPEKTISTAFERQESNQDTWASMSSAFVSAGIPLHVIQNANLRTWLMQNLKEGLSLPSERTLRRYLTNEGVKDLEQTKDICTEEDVIIIIDETQDIKNRKIVNVLIAPAKPKVPFRLLNSEDLDHCTAANVVQFILRSLQLISIPLNRVVAVVSDNARYMIAAGNLFTPLTGRAIHTTCWAHILHLIAEEIRGSFTTADSFISKVKAALVKAPSRRAELSEILKKNGKTSLPPTPVITRWTTWLATGSYHSENFVYIKEWIEKAAADSAAIKTLKELVGNSELESELKQINDIYPSLSSTIKKLEGSFVPATDVYLLLQTTLALLTSTPTLLTSFQKLESYMNEIHPSKDFWKEVEFIDPRRYHKFENINLELPTTLKNIAAKDIPLNEMATYKSICAGYGAAESFCPIKFWNGHKRELPTLSKVALTLISIPPTSAEVERSFSSLNRLLTPDRNRLTIENIGIHLRLQFNNRQNVTVNEDDSENEEMEGEIESDSE